MSHEIELKFQINQEDIANLQAFLNQWASSDELEFSSLSKKQRTFSTLSLANSYYDTADNYLRNHHCGLRLRSTENNQTKQYEMTLKRDSHAIAGLHERAEYNVDLSQPQLDLSLFPAQVFPKACDITTLQQNLKPLFTTNFTRQVWLISFANSEIEVALDQGEITSNGQTIPIQEVELEIKHGNKHDLLNFANELSRFHLHLFSQSKAARGYRLLNNQKISPTEFELTQQSSLFDIIKYWQKNEEYALSIDNLDFYKRVLDQVNHQLMNKADKFNPELTQWQMALSAINTIKTFAFSEINTTLKLMLIAQIDNEVKNE
ncbi:MULTISPECIES: inorganic triphosphatase [unclassified Gilliamella]|uniref:CYTH domain-containing protein n=1 Tax=unclassified Gilliamella TaxID=2685620 RepID=UPI0022699BFC|nr:MULTISPECIES: CYTH domain-containing protein [unclassified Gilliamella]MCX8601968.1 CYTH domain-containing protein [Gilliamella sp. B3722]MCX8608242.1 CYTH domain-containing protein [Gilliamella sp. B3771]MCX8611236.1 CYTH domain-containing protein [Gilliamella sp. B3891]MCX8613639.1 CYTH domain-containing protein [Gilliamella sp. B3773]MCX8615068.1 CYTH domain-containing protein [Gilliamella sp. B3770]